jgi:hypothetical protein
MIETREGIIKILSYVHSLVGAATFSITTLSIMGLFATLSAPVLSAFVVSVIMLSVKLFKCHSECRDALMLWGALSAQMEASMALTNLSIRHLDQ